ncbi:MAG: transposase, partial [Planctomycetota bacterium]
MSAGYMKPGPKATGGRGKIARGTVEEVADGSSRGSGDRAASRGGTKSGVRKASKTAATARAPGRTPKPSERLFSMADFSISDPEQLQTLMNESMQGFAVELGVQMAVCLLQDNVLTLCGAKSERVLNRTVSRHGSQEGYVILGGQKVAIRRPRVRSAEGEECELDVYSKLQSEHAMPHAALTRMVRGVSCRDYAAVVETARAGFGVKKSSVSKHFIKASSKQLAEFDERRFDNLTFAAIFIDGVNFGGEMLVV